MDEHESNKTQPTPAWATLHLWHMQPVRDVLLGLGIFALILLAQKASVVTVPLLLAILLAYLFEPVIVWLMKRLKISRRSSVISIIAGLILFVAIPAMLGTTYAVGQLIAFSTNTATNIDHVNQALGMQNPEQAAEYLRYSIDPEGVVAPSGAEGDPSPAHSKADNWIWIQEQIRDSQTNGSMYGNAFDTALNWISENQDQIATTATGVGVNAIKSVLSILGAVFGLSFMAFVTAFFFFFTATEWVGLQHFGTNLLPDKNRDRIIDLLVKFDRVISGFIRGRITIAFIQSIVFSIGFFIIGVPGAFILGPAVAVLSIVPYLALIGVPIAVSLLWLQGYSGIRGEIWWVLGAPTVLYFLGQALDDYAWTPLIQGKSTGMDTPTILFASLAGGALFGIFGLLIAIPIAACVKILIQEVFWPKFKDWAEGRAADPLPIDN
jgi:predicted PurR-regulated permease PerM